MQPGKIHLYQIGPPLLTNPAEYQIRLRTPSVTDHVSARFDDPGLSCGHVSLGRPQ